MSQILDHQMVNSTPERTRHTSYLRTQIRSPQLEFIRDQPPVSQSLHNLDSNSISVHAPLSYDGKSNTPANLPQYQASPVSAFNAGGQGSEIPSSP